MNTNTFLYKFQVVAFTNADHSESSAITIKTSGLGKKITKHCVGNFHLFSQSY